MADVTIEQVSLNPDGGLRIRRKRPVLTVWTPSV
jgi:hypothetical protein